MTGTPNDIPVWRRRQNRDRAMRLAQSRRAGDRSRRIERERKAQLDAETTAILTTRRPLLRKVGTINRPS